MGKRSVGSRPNNTNIYIDVLLIDQTDYQITEVISVNLSERLSVVWNIYLV